MKRRATWTCRRRKDNVICGAVNPTAKRKCVRCGAAKPPRRQPTHMRALTIGYDEYVLLNGGERCAICLRVSSSTRKLDRDHDHRTGRARGLLCSRCNRALPAWVTSEWLRAAADYLERAAA